MLQSVNIAMNLTAFLLSGLLLIALGMSGGPRERVSRWYFAMVLLSLVGAPCDMLVMSLSGTPGRAAYIAMRVVDGISFGIAGLFILAAAMYFYEFLSTKGRIPRIFLWMQGSWAVLVTVLVVVAQFTPILARFGEGNRYEKGPLFWLYQLFLILSLLACMALTLRSIRHLRRREWLSLLAYTVLPLLCDVAEVVFAGLWFAYLGSAVALFLIYLNIQVELKNRLLAKEAELAEGRIAMMLSQIQPHFIFNTLTSISEVCDGNPLAQESLITFSEYLRINMDALVQKTPIPFAQELAHVKQYLWLEQLRFEEKLSVVYDIRADDFVLPVLTLQPIVENAVKHGITRKAGPGTVWIGTERTDGGVRVCVTDDGVGFSPAAPRDGGRRHTGLDNVRARLGEMSGGRLCVQSAPGQGTKVTIFLPDLEGESA